MSNFGIIGVAGFVAPRHLKAIKDTNNNLVLALDPHDSVGVLDDYFPKAMFFTQPELFERYLEIIQYSTDQIDEKINYVSICSPNYLHDPHIRIALRANCHAICEKPLSIDPMNLCKIQDLEAKLGYNVYTILQLRYHPSLIELHNKLQSNPSSQRAQVCLTYITRRGEWYKSSWKASVERSGGLAMNIGVHFFDILIWLFGQVEKSTVQLSKPNKMSGILDLEKATVKWFLSIDEADLPEECTRTGKYSYRTIILNGDRVEFSDGFTGLHTKVYEDILRGGGQRINDAKPSLLLVNQINNCDITPVNRESHPFLHQL